MIMVYHYESDNKHMQSLCLYHMSLVVVCNQSQIANLTPSDIISTLTKETQQLSAMF